MKIIINKCPFNFVKELKNFQNCSFYLWYYKNMNFETLYPINTEKAYIIHFRYKSTEELINKLKRGYSNWFKNKLRKFIIGNIETYLKINKPTLEKINFIEKELKINLSRYK